MKISLTIDAKHLDIETDNATELERLAILSNIFQMMGVQNDLSEMVDDFIKIGKAYKAFYSGIESIEPTDQESPELELKYPKKDEQEVDEPDHYKSGIIEEEGKKKYKCRLHCSCGNHKNLYIENTSKNIDCPKCHKVHKVRNAKSEGFPIRDSWGNYFIAGQFIGEDEM